MEEINPKDLSADIAKRVTALRLQRAWTREVLAEHSGVNVYTLKHFERTGQISLHRLISIAQALDVFGEVERLFKPRHRVDVNNWQVEPQVMRKRGRRRTSTPAVAKDNVTSMAQTETAQQPAQVEEVAS